MSIRPLPRVNSFEELQALLNERFRQIEERLTQPSAAASFPPNPFGLFETLGNVREWTCSVHAPYTTPAAGECGNPGEAAQVSVRGGSWLQGAGDLAANQREAYEPYRRNVWTGFRVVQEAGSATR